MLTPEMDMDTSETIRCTPASGKNASRVDTITLPKAWTFASLYGCKDNAIERYNRYIVSDRNEIRAIAAKWDELRKKVVDGIYPDGRMFINVRKGNTRPNPVSCPAHHASVCRNCISGERAAKVSGFTCVNKVLPDKDPASNVAAMAALYILNECSGILQDFARHVLSETCHELYITRHDKDTKHPEFSHVSTIMRRSGRRVVVDENKFERGEKEAFEFHAAMLLNSLATVLIIAEEFQTHVRKIELSQYLRGIFRARLERLIAYGGGAEMPLFLAKSTSEFVKKYITPMSSRARTPNKTLYEIIDRHSSYVCDTNTSPYSVNPKTQGRGTQTTECLTTLLLNSFHTHKHDILDRLGVLRETDELLVTGSGKIEPRLPMPYVVLRALPFCMAYPGREILYNGLHALVSEDTHTEEWSVDAMIQLYVLLTHIAIVSMYRTGFRFGEIKRLYRMKGRPSEIGRVFGIEECAIVTLQDGLSGSRCGQYLKDIVMGTIKDGPVDLRGLARSDATVTLRVYTDKQKTTRNDDSSKPESSTVAARFEKRTLRRDFSSGPMDILPVLMTLCRLNHHLFPSVDKRTDATKRMGDVAKKVGETLKAMNNALKGVDGFKPNLVRAVDCIIRTPFAIETLPCKNAEGEYGEYYKLAAVAMNHTEQTHDTRSYANATESQFDMGEGKNIGYELYSVDIADIDEWRKDTTSERDMFVISWLPNRTPTTPFVHNIQANPRDPLESFKAALVEFWRLLPARHDPLHTHLTGLEPEALRLLLSALRDNGDGSWESVARNVLRILGAPHVEPRPQNALTRLYVHEVTSTANPLADLCDDQENVEFNGVGEQIYISTRIFCAIQVRLTLQHAGRIHRTP
jgi:hypothetical protein